MSSNDDLLPIHNVQSLLQRPHPLTLQVVDGIVPLPIEGELEGVSYLFSIIDSTIGFLKLSQAGNNAESTFSTRMAAKHPTNSRGANNISPVTMGAELSVVLSKNMPSSSVRKL